MTIRTSLSTAAQSDLLAILEDRFRKYPHRHPSLHWQAVRDRLVQFPEKLWSLQEMERTGGEPDVVGQELSGSGFTFMDCSAESPAGRRSLCYDYAALEARKDARPANAAVELAAAMGIHLLDEQQYRELQQLEHVDQKTSSWLLTPPDIRALGGAIFGDFRYGTVFIYHNGASSYYAARGFRGCLVI